MQLELYDVPYVIMPRGGATAYGSLFVCHYAEGGATEA